MPARLLARFGTTLLFVALAACGREARTLASEQPQTPPNGPNDPRAARYEDNVYQVAQGGRYFTWYGCGRCHGPEATGALDLGDDRWRHGRALTQVYGFIARGHAGDLAHYGERIPVEQLWQMTAYVRGLEDNDPAKNRRDDMDAKGEPQGPSWPGAVR